MSFRIPSTSWISLTRVAFACVRSLDACKSVWARWMLVRSWPACTTTAATVSARDDAALSRTSSPARACRPAADCSTAATATRFAEAEIRAAPSTIRTPNAGRARSAPRRSNIVLMFAANRRVSDPPAGTARAEVSPDSKSSTTSVSAATGCVNHHVTKASPAASTANVPRRNQIPKNRVSQVTRGGGGGGGDSGCGALAFKTRRFLADRRGIASTGGSLFTKERPRRACQLGRDLALPGGRKRDLLGGFGHRPAAGRDLLDGLDSPVDGGTLVLAGELDLAARIGHLHHHGQPELHLPAPILDRGDSRAGPRLSRFYQSCDLRGGRLGALGQAPHLVGDHGEPSS